jgi:hypothetical protein
VVAGRQTSLNHVGSNELPAVALRAYDEVACVRCRRQTVLHVTIRR